ncbi:MAG: P-loop NTPase fold protein [Pyrinomonadaceae bacterium]
MIQQQSAPARYWVFKDSDENSFLPSNPTPPNVWFVDPSTSEAKPSDIVYFWHEEDSAYFYGWGIIVSGPAPAYSAAMPNHYRVEVEHHLFTDHLVTSGQLSEVEALRSLAELRQVTNEIIELTAPQAAALNQILKDNGVEAPPDPVVEPPDDRDNGKLDNEEPADKSLGVWLEKHQDRLSDLTTTILDQSEKFANKRLEEREKITTSCIMFAAIESGKDLHAEAGALNASQFLLNWINALSPQEYKEQLAGFLGSNDHEPWPVYGKLTSHSADMLETAISIANFVRQESTASSGKINARDLVGALIFMMARNPKLGAAQRMTAMGVDLDDLRIDYVKSFLAERNEADDIKKWRHLLVDLRTPTEDPRVPRDVKRSLPPISADTPSLIDDLNITPEVTGFANIIAARDVKTPLSIGLFGDWGSGKSTFMEQLQAQVETIASDVRAMDKKEETSFLGNIVQIRFNAWHYAEGNLWASLVSHIFDNLSFTEKGDKENAEKRKQLFLGQLASGLAEKRAAEADVKLKEDDYQLAKTDLEGAMRAQEDARLDKLQWLTEGVWPLVRQALRGNDEAQQVVNEARALLGKKGLTEEELRRELEASRSSLGRAQLHITSAIEHPRRKLIVAGILILTILLPIGLAYLVSWLTGSQTLDRIVAGVVPLITLAGGMFAWFRSNRPTVNGWLNTIDEAERHLDTMYQNARGRFNAELSRLNEDVTTKQAEINKAKERVTVAKTQVAETMAVLRDMEPARVLENFVQERAASEDYRKLLGVVALIRRDFKQLSDMLRDQDNVELKKAVAKIVKKDDELRKQKATDKDEALTPGVIANGTASGDALSENPVIQQVVTETMEEHEKQKAQDEDGTVSTALAGNGSSGSTAPSKDDEVNALTLQVDEKLKEYRIDRIVLYIDDLDRCPPKLVVDVLQAIHLLLAFELFVVVVGVDARWIRQSLRRRFPVMLGEDWDGGNVPARDESRQAQAATPRDYIEKIFQVPFWLKPLNVDAARDLLKGLIPDKELSPSKPEGNENTRHQVKPGSDPKQKPEEEKDPPNLETKPPNGSDTTSNQGTGSSKGKTTEPDSPGSAKESDQHNEQPKKSEFVFKPENLLLERKERDAMIALSRIIGTTPRTLKRFVNIYRIIKAGLDGDQLEDFIGTGPSGNQYLAVLLLLGIAHGLPDVAPVFFLELKKHHEKAVGSKKKNVGLKTFLEDVPILPVSNDPTLKPAWTFLISELQAAPEEATDIPLADLRKWLPVVVRYTFQLGRLSSEVAPERPGSEQRLIESYRLSQVPSL